MNSYYEPNRFLIVASIRSGGTLLSHALDSHTGIYCHRGEPVHGKNPIRNIASNPIEALDAVLSFHGYHATVAKITWQQYDILKEELKGLNLTGIIFLYRENPLRVFISEQVRLIDSKNNQLAHTFDKRPIVKVTVDIDETLEFIKDYELRRDRIQQETFQDYDKHFSVSYEQLTDRAFRQIPRMLGMLLCDFLGVGYQLLQYNLARRNPYPLSEIITNWQELQVTIDFYYPQYINFLNID